MLPANPIRILYTPRPPNAFTGCRRFPQLVPTIDCPFPGWVVEVLTTLVQNIGRNITSIATEGESLDYGEKLPNGSWTGLFGLLQNGSIDLICATFKRTIARADSFDYSYPLTNFQPLFVAKKVHLKTATTILNNFAPFHAYVWACLGAVLLLYMLVFPLIAYVEYKMNLREKEEMFKMPWNTIAAQLLNHPESLYFRSFGGKFALLVFSLLSTGVLMYCYEGFVIFSILRPDKPFPFTENEMISRIADKSISLVTMGQGYWFGSFLKETGGDFLERLRHALQGNPIIFATNSSGVKDRISTGRAVFFSSEDDSTLLKVRELCDIVTNPMSLNQMTTHLMFQRGSRLTALFNKEIIRQQSFIHRTQRKYFESGFRLNKVAKCIGDQKVNDRFSMPMSVLDFQCVLVLLGCGLGTGLVAFTLELLFRKIEDQLNKRRRNNSIEHPSLLLK